MAHRSPEDEFPHQNGTMLRVFYGFQPTKGKTKVTKDSGIGAGYQINLPPSTSLCVSRPPSMGKTWILTLPRGALWRGTRGGADSPGKVGKLIDCN